MVINLNFSFVRGSAKLEGQRIADEVVNQITQGVNSGFGAPHEIQQAVAYRNAIVSLIEVSDDMPGVDNRLQGGWIQFGTSELGVPQIRLHVN